MSVCDLLVCVEDFADGGQELGLLVLSFLFDVFGKRRVSWSWSRS
jgi:hypothetical protein